MTAIKQTSAKSGNRKKNGSSKPAKVIHIDMKAVEALQEEVHSAWAFAAAALWNGRQFSPLEAAAAKIQIGMHLFSTSLPEAALEVFCQRVMLAKQYLLPPSGSKPAVPSQWFAPDNESGYKATEALFAELERQRIYEPSAMPGIKLLSAAVCGFAKTPGGENYRSFREQLTAMKEPGLAQVFQIYAANRAYDY